MINAPDGRVEKERAEDAVGFAARRSSHGGRVGNAGATEGQKETTIVQGHHTIEASSGENDEVSASCRTEG